MGGTAGTAGGSATVGGASNGGAGGTSAGTADSTSAGGGSAAAGASGLGAGGTAGTAGANTAGSGGTSGGGAGTAGSGTAGGGSASGGTAGAAATYPTPVTTHRAIGVHDPRLIQVRNTYYLFDTGGRLGFRSSTNLATWSDAGTTTTTAKRTARRYS